MCFYFFLCFPYKDLKVSQALYSYKKKSYNDNSIILGVNDCSNNNNGCAELCLNTPTKAVCACSNGYKLLPDGKSCTKDNNYIAPSVCGADYFQCSTAINGSHCIPHEHVCDGTEDCPDGSDESRSKGGPCENIVCNENQHRCDGSVCIAKYWVCDGDKDCNDGSDEDPQFCPGHCSEKQFTCEITKKCIPQAWRCDNVVDCGRNDNSDEKNCSK